MQTGETQSAEEKSTRQETLVCMDCGSPYGRYWSTPEGKAILCPTCATVNGLGCP